MTLSAQAAAVLLRCEREGEHRSSLTEDWPQLDSDLAYRVQDEALHQRLSRGEQLVGVKVDRLPGEANGGEMALTAWLTDAMLVPIGAPIPRGRMMSPRIEPEIAFHLGDDLEGPGVSTAAALAAVDQVYAGLEILDSRYADGGQSTVDLIADNGSTAGFTLGSVSLPPERLDLAFEACLVSVDGAVEDSATGRSVQGHPAQALASAANALSRRGQRLKAGWIVLTGGMTESIPLPPGQSVALHYSNLGSIFVNGGSTN